MFFVDIIACFAADYLYIFYYKENYLFLKLILLSDNFFHKLFMGDGEKLKSRLMRLFKYSY
ncbi:hypothetical protein ATW97_02205 [Oenococcus oeni]|uniref:Uncharacterized protein n=1 Tax=Oenococcus oeni TaxID=1247 RepID=A0A6N4A8A3_OENOE|nr:hypothetical protein EL27_08315 [Oenococcus oeni]KEP87910.1 hypothetical protein X279_05335 [Oenococcus oeni IOEB_0501]KGH60501.1 hypothetical protein X288_01380 [Oenococcus oeni IOEB_9805]KGH65584.1 hypothetical protein X291_06490 [Oenococcus oeni IOEB_C23]KGH73725.1 hypothetical protein X280_02040 [Oenococcus oeni IOEB_0502]KGH75454.1 hypothetical protein X287_06145 [Oenococcus oeni IOEB_9803]KGH77436.1 hypothetical protein X285_04840 [Oenococcus oeni IOEB_9304]KGH85321.1 hypothetical p